MSIQQSEEQTTKAIVSFSPRQALEHTESNNTIIVDIRPEYETSYRVFDVPRVIFLTYDTYREDCTNLPHGSLLIVADSVGMQSKEVARYLMEQGYDEVACLAGGMVQWDRDGLPLSKDTEYEMVGGCACRLHPQKTQE